VQTIGGEKEIVVGSVLLVSFADRISRPDCKFGLPFLKMVKVKVGAPVPLAPLKRVKVIVPTPRWGARLVKVNLLLEVIEHLSFTAA